MNKLKQKLMQFFQGRYGNDELNRTISIIALVLYVLGIVLQNQLLASVAIAGMVYTIIRAMSRDFWTRSAENRKYLDFIHLNKMRFEQRKTHRIFKCKGCGKNIRVPKGKGKIEVRCPKCGNRSIHRT